MDHQVRLYDDDDSTVALGAVAENIGITRRTLLNAMKENEIIFEDRGRICKLHKEYEWIIYNDYARYYTDSKESKPYLRWTTKGKEWIVKNFDEWNRRSIMDFENISIDKQKVIMQWINSNLKSKPTISSDKRHNIKYLRQAMERDIKFKISNTEFKGAMCKCNFIHNAKMNFNISNSSFNVIGIYAIKNYELKKAYIGESLDVERRWKEHITDLNNNTHHSYKLQDDFNKYGIDAFKFEMIETIKNVSNSGFKNKMRLIYLEHLYITKYDTINKGYNVEDTLHEILNNNKFAMSKKADKPYLKNLIKSNAISINPNKRIS